MFVCPRYYPSFERPYYYVCVTITTASSYYTPRPEPHGFLACPVALPGLAQACFFSLHELCTRVPADAPTSRAPRSVLPRTYHVRDTADRFASAVMDVVVKAGLASKCVTVTTAPPRRGCVGRVAVSATTPMQICLVERDPSMCAVPFFSPSLLHAKRWRSF